MWYILISGFGFFNLILFTLFQAHHRKRLTILFSIIGYGPIFSAMLFMILTFKAAESPSWLITMEAVLAGLFFLLLLYSNFIEIPLNSPYRRGSRRVIRRGFYGVVRHPGLLWFIICHFFLNAVFRNWRFALISASMILMNVVLVILEDTVFFPRIFSDYQDYKQRVPFIFPRLMISRWKDPKRSRD